MTTVKPPEVGARLTLRELDVLRDAANGLTAEASAAKLHLSTGSIVDARKRARIKLGAENTAHAVALAMRHGDILFADVWETVR